MKLTRASIYLFANALLMLAVCADVNGQTNQGNTKNSRTNIVTMHTSGTSEVKATPMAAEDSIGDPKIGRLSLEKKLSGGITGISRGQMLGYQSDEKGKGGYVAIEQISGTVDGKKGSFGLQHHGTMDGENYVMDIYVVPGSGAGELSGISGKFTIKMEKGGHSYDFEYTLPAVK